MNHASVHDLVAELDMILSSDELQDTWDAESMLTPMPNVTFRAEGRRVVMHFSPYRGSLPGIQDIKRFFTIAMHRKSAFPACRIRWIT